MMKRFAIAKNFSELNFKIELGRLSNLRRILSMFFQIFHDSQGTSFLITVPLRIPIGILKSFSNSILLFS